MLVLVIGLLSVSDLAEHSKNIAIVAAGNFTNHRNFSFCATYSEAGSFVAAATRYPIAFNLDCFIDCAV